MNVLKKTIMTMLLVGFTLSTTLQAGRKFHRPTGKKRAAIKAQVNQQSQKIKDAQGENVSKGPKSGLVKYALVGGALVVVVAGVAYCFLSGADSNAASTEDMETIGKLCDVESDLCYKEESLDRYHPICSIGDQLRYIWKVCPSVFDTRPVALSHDFAVRLLDKARDAFSTIDFDAVPEYPQGQEDKFVTAWKALFPSNS